MNPSSLSRRQKLGLLILAVSLMAGFLAYNVYRDFLSDGGAPGEPQPSSAIDIPDADLPEASSSKVEAYRRGTSAERLWSDAAEDLYAEEGGASGARGGAPAPSEVYITADELVAELSGGSATPPPSPRSPSVQGQGQRQNPSSSSSSSPSSSGGGPRIGEPGYREHRMKVHSDRRDAATRAAIEAVQAAEEGADMGLPESPSSAGADEDPRQEEGLGTRAAVRKTSAMSSLDDGWGDGESGFTSLSDPADTAATASDYPFECMFVRAERLTDGSRVAVRLLEDMVIGGVLIPRNTHLQAMCSIDTRLQIRVASIEMNSRIFSLGYEAYDSDGYRGIYCPDLGSHERKQVKSKGLNLFSSLIGSRVGRAVNDVVRTGVSIAENRNGQVTVSVPAGYRFFIVKQKNS